MMEKLLERAYRWMQSFIPLVGILLLLGCKTQPPLKFEEQTDSTVQTDREVTTDREISTSLSEELERFYRSWSEKLTETVGSWQRDEYSAPDSTGQQYKVATVTGTFNSIGKEHRQDSSIVRSSVQALITENIRLKARLDAVEKTLTDLSAERKADLSWWQSALMWLGGILVIIVLIRLFWRKLP